MKEKFFRGVLSHKMLILLIFLVLVVISGLCKKYVKINYDMNSYLPKESLSTISKNIMQDEFESGIPNARAMVSNISVPNALKMKEAMMKVEGVSDVIWLDDALDTNIPLEVQDEETVENYYRDGNALFTLTIDDGKRLEAVNGIWKIIGEDSCMTGYAVDNATATVSTTRELPKIFMLVVPFTLLVLCITTTSWFEPVLIIVSIAIAIIINNGSNIIFGEISFVTNAAGSVLLLAVSLDYLVFLIHRFKEIRKTGVEPEEAIVQALCKSLSSILSSGLTTVIGFLALAFMKFQIGPDLGFALGKGVTISLITVFVLTPVLILYCYKLIDKSTHRSFMPNFHGLGRLVSRTMIPLAVLFIIIIIPTYLASINDSYYFGSSKIFGSETKLGQDTEKIEEAFGKSNNFVVMVPIGDLASEKAMSDEIKEMPQVITVLSYVDKAGTDIPTEYIDEETLSKFMNKNYSRMVISIKTGFEGEETFNIVEKIRKIAAAYYPDENYVAGESVSTYDVKESVTEDMKRVNLIAIGAVFFVLLISFKSVILPFILVLAIETAVWINLSIPYYTGTTIFYMAYLIISSIQLGATVDYAILFTDRYVEFRADYSKKTAVKKTISVVTGSVLTSGIIMAGLGFFLGGMTSHGVLSQLGYFLGKGGICSLGIVLFVLPGLLYLMDKPIQLATMKISFVNDKKNECEATIGLEEVN